MRPHSSLGYLTPAEVAEELLATTGGYEKPHGCRQVRSYILRFAQPVTVNRSKAWALVGVLAAISLVINESLPSSKHIIPSNATIYDHYRDLGTVPDLYAAFIGRNGRIFGIEDHFLYMSEDGGRYFGQLGVLPKVNATWVDRFTDILARSKLARSLRRNQGPTNVVVLSSGTILVFYDHIYRSTDNGSTFEPVFSFVDIGAPFSYSEGVTVGPDDTVYFGEYITTSRPHEVRIFQGVNDGREWQVVHTFPSGEIFHVHSVQYDPYRSWYWITTGDQNSESKVLYTADGFRSLHLLGGGSQDWRVVSLMITQDNLFWGSDNDVEPASIFRWNVPEARLSKIIEIGKPSYYSTVLYDGTLVLSTTYEPESQFARTYHPEPTTDLWASRDGTVWTKMLSLDYERNDMPWGPSRATIAFPNGSKSHELLFTPLSTAKNDFQTQFVIPKLRDSR